MLNKIIAFVAFVFCLNAWSDTQAVFISGAGDLHWKAPAASVASLPSTGNAPGDIRIETTGFSVQVWNGSAWVNSAASSAITQLTGDVTAGPGSGSQTAVVALVGGSTAANVHSAELSANAATALNTASTIVKRDGSGQSAHTTLNVSTAVNVGNSTTAGALRVGDAALHKGNVIFDNTSGSTTQSVLSLTCSGNETVCVDIEDNGNGGAAVQYLPGAFEWDFDAGVRFLNAVNLVGGGTITSTAFIHGGEGVFDSNAGGGSPANTVALTARGSPTQNVDLFQAKNSAGTVLAKVDKLGNINSSGTVSGTNITAAGNVAGTSTNVTGTVAIANGGTNSTAALSNNRVIKSSGGALVESAAITANQALISDANGIPTQSVTTSTELGYSSGVTSAIQTQLNSKPTVSLANLVQTQGGTVRTEVVAWGPNGSTCSATVAPTTGCSSTPCKICNNPTGDVSSVSFNATGNYTVNFTTAFTVAPVCTISVTNFAGGLTNADFCIPTGYTTTSVTYQCDTVMGAAGNVSANVICTGAK